MKSYKFCVNSGFLGMRRDRFTEYQPARDLKEKFFLASQIKGLHGIELKYPFDLQDIKLAKQLLEDNGLQCSAVNVDIKDANYFRYGALSGRSIEARKRAISLMQEGMDIAVELGTDLLSTCPLADGYDYPFQLDYTRAWSRFIETVAEIVSYRDDVKLALEYQPHEPHAKILLGNVGKLLHVCAEVGAPNVGANLDIGHSFAALESPAESAALLASKGRLFYVHTNDNTGDGGDWDMLSGSVHLWHWLELLYTLDQVGYDGWLGGDIAPKHTGPVAAYDTNFKIVQRMVNFLENIGTDKITEILAEDSDVAETFNYLSEQLMPNL
jgi:xylose isomerase